MQQLGHQGLGQLGSGACATRQVNGFDSRFGPLQRSGARQGTHATQIGACAVHARQAKVTTRVLHGDECPTLRRQACSHCSAGLKRLAVDGNGFVHRGHRPQSTQENYPIGIGRHAGYHACSHTLLGQSRHHGLRHASAFIGHDQTLCAQHARQRHAHGTGRHVTHGKTIHAGKCGGGSCCGRRSSCRCGGARCTHVVNDLTQCAQSRQFGRLHLR